MATAMRAEDRSGDPCRRRPPEEIESHHGADQDEDEPHA